MDLMNDPGEMLMSLGINLGLVIEVAELCGQ